MPVQHAMTLQPERLDFSLAILLQRLLRQDVPEDNCIVQSTCTKTSAEISLLALLPSKVVPSMSSGLPGRAGRVTRVRKLQAPERFLWDVSHPVMNSDSRALVKLPCSPILHANLHGAAFIQLFRLGCTCCSPSSQHVTSLRRKHVLYLFGAAVSAWLPADQIGTSCHLIIQKFATLSTDCTV